MEGLAGAAPLTIGERSEATPVKRKMTWHGRSLLRTSIAFALVLATAACNGDPRCNTSNCETLHVCGLSQQGEPQDIVRCFPSESTNPSSLLLPYCVDACQASGNGALLACISSKFGSSCLLADGGRPSLEDISAACLDATQPTCGSNCATCQNGCGGAWSTCNSACPTADESACFACEYTCSQQNVSCDKACPTN
jgi:hypothetical protein